MDIDFTDLKQLNDLMDRAAEFDTMLLGKSEQGELVCTSINEDCVIAETYQDNGWVRKNIYYRDGSREEMYSKE